MVLRKKKSLSLGLTEISTSLMYVYLGVVSPLVARAQPRHEARGARERVLALLVERAALGSGVR